MNRKILITIGILVFALILIGWQFQKELKIPKTTSTKPANLSQVKVVSQYRWVTDRISQMRGLDEVIKLFKETKTDFIFQGWLIQWPLPEKCSDLPSETERKVCEENGYSYEHLRNAISEIKKEMPNVIFSGGMQAEYLYPDDVSGNTDQERRDKAWAMALDPSKWGINMSKRDMQCYWAKKWGIVGKDEECPVEEELKLRMSRRHYFPDLTNPDFQKVFLNRAYKQIDAGADAIWIDMLYVQANIFKEPYFGVSIDENHPFVQESHKAASKIVDSIHEYGEKKGKYIYVITWVVVKRDGSIIQLHPKPNVDIAMTSPDPNEIFNKNTGKIGQFNEREWTEIAQRLKGLGIPVFARIDYGGTRTPLSVFSQELTKEQQRGFLKKADKFYSGLGINFIYPIHGGDMGQPQSNVKKLSYGKFNWYDALAPEFDTYETIKQLAKSKRGK